MSNRKMGFMEVRIERAKELLNEAGQENINQIISTLNGILMKELKKLSKSYQDMYNRAVTIPENEDELMELRNFSEEKEMILSQLGLCY